MRGTTYAVTELDQIDHDKVCRKLIKFNAYPDARCGDYVIFADGIQRRISYVYDKSWGDMSGVQTSDGGSWYFDSGGRCDFSGGLYPPVKMDTLTLTDEIKMGRVWVFHHDGHWAGNAINVDIPFRVYKCSVKAPK